MENLKQKTKSGTYETIGHTAASVLLQTVPIAAGIGLVFLIPVVIATLHSTQAEVSELAAKINTLFERVRNAEKLGEDLGKIALLCLHRHILSSSTGRG